MAASTVLKKQLKRASRDAVKTAITKLRRHISNQHWIGLNNIYAKLYRRNPVDHHSPSDVIFRGRNLQQRQISDYVAASIFTHCGDGWSLLGRALNLQGKGDVSSCVHLAYYAELRAAMSLLATEGIGVFNKQHVIMTGSTSGVIPTTLNGTGRTHKFVWDVLEYWANRKLSSEILGEIITPGSIPLSDWFNAFGVQTYLQSVGSAWLKTWGIDIKRFGEDQILRNHSSYRPSRILPKIIVPADDSLSFSSELWKMCEPDSGSRFNEIDKHLLRESLAKIYITSIPPFADPHTTTNNAKYKLWIEQGITHLGLVPEVQVNWVNFLTWNIQPNTSRIIESAAGTASVEDPAYHLQVLARAVLLLRISTGISGKLLRETGFTKDDLKFWWHPYATDHGLIKKTMLVSDFMDLWSDIDVAIQDIETWKSSNPAPYSYNQLARNVSHQLSLLGECERISLWGLGI